MNTTTNSIPGTYPDYPDQTADMVDSTADRATGAIRSTQNASNGAFDRLSEKVEEVRSQAGPALSRLASQAESAARRSADTLRDTSQQLRDRALRASDDTVTYIRDEPVKAMLIAAATGAALMALLSMMGRSSDRD